jgi:hypothetical protein
MGVITPLIRNLVSRLRLVVIFRPWLLYSLGKIPLYMLHRRLSWSQSRHGHFGEETNLFRSRKSYGEIMYWVVTLWGPWLNVRELVNNLVTVYTDTFYEVVVAAVTDRQELLWIREEMDCYPCVRFYPNWLCSYCSSINEFIISVTFFLCKRCPLFCTLLRAAWLCYCNSFNPLNIKNNVKYI